MNNPNTKKFISALITVLVPGIILQTIAIAFPGITLASLSVLLVIVPIQLLFLWIAFKLDKLYNIKFPYTLVLLNTAIAIVPYLLNDKNIRELTIINNGNVLDFISVGHINWVGVTVGSWLLTIEYLRNKNKHLKRV